MLPRDGERKSGRRIVFGAPNLCGYISSISELAKGFARFKNQLGNSLDSPTDTGGYLLGAQ